MAPASISARAGAYFFSPRWKSHPGSRVAAVFDLASACMSALFTCSRWSQLAAPNLTPSRVAPAENIAKFGKLGFGDFRNQLVSQQRDVLLCAFRLIPKLGGNNVRAKKCRHDFKRLLYAQLFV